MYDFLPQRRQSCAGGGADVQAVWRNPALAAGARRNAAIDQVIAKDGRLTVGFSTTSQILIFSHLIDGYS